MHVRVRDVLIWSMAAGLISGAIGALFRGSFVDGIWIGLLVGVLTPLIWASRLYMWLFERWFLGRDDDKPSRFRKRYKR